MLEKNWFKRFPVDYKAEVYHPESVVSLSNIIDQLTKFFNIDRDIATEFFINKAFLAEIDVLKVDSDGFIRPATFDGAQTILSNWENILASWDSSYDEGVPCLLDQKYFFIREQVLKVINNEVYGENPIFNLDKLTKSDEKLGERERNTLLIVISALIEHAGIGLNKPSKAAGIIASLTEEKGAPVSDSAIENIIKKIPDALKKRSK